jgi:hypothetical protein
MNVKRIAAEVVAALPADAHFEDLDEFLFERAQVEEGREDFELGRVLASREVLGETARDVFTFIWSQSAETSFREATDRQDHAQDSLVAAVAEVVRKLDHSEESDITLPEMGDPSIRERYVRTPRGRYRVLYDRQGSKHRVLWFTNNTTCYRNVRPDPS